MSDVPDEVNARAISMMKDVGRRAFPTVLKEASSVGDRELFVVPVLVLAVIWKEELSIASCSFHLPEQTEQQVATLLERVRGNITGDYEAKSFRHGFNGNREVPLEDDDDRD